MFRPYILAIFRELHIWWTCTDYMATYAVHMYLLEEDQDKWAKHVRFMCNKYKSIVQLVGGVILCYSKFL